MAYLPPYMEINWCDNKNKPRGLTLKVKIKKWGVPILVFKALKSNNPIRLWQWFAFPYLCFKLMQKRG
jgi:hypothetical protein